MNWVTADVVTSRFIVGSSCSCISREEAYSQTQIARGIRFAQRQARRKVSGIATETRRDWVRCVLGNRSSRQTGITVYRLRGKRLINAFTTTLHLSLPPIETHITPPSSEHCPYIVNSGAPPSASQYLQELQPVTSRPQLAQSQPSPEQSTSGPWELYSPSCIASHTYHDERSNGKQTRRHDRCSTTLRRPRC